MKIFGKLEEISEARIRKGGKEYVIAGPSSDSGSGGTYAFPNNPGASDTVVLANASQTLVNKAMQGLTLTAVGVDATSIIGRNALNQLSTVTIAGTSNQVSVSAFSGGTITLSLPQSIHTGATPTFSKMTLGGGEINLTGDSTAAANRIARTADGTLNLNNSAIVTSASSVAFFTDKGGPTSAGDWLLGGSGARSFVAKAASGLTGIYRNCYVTSGDRGNRTSTSVTGSAIELQANPSNGVTIAFWANVDDAAVDAAATLIGSATTSGDWSFPGKLTVAGSGTDATSILGRNAGNELATVTLAGTSNQVSVSAFSGGTITLSLPQNIHSGASPTFASVNIGSGGPQILTGTNDPAATSTSAPAGSIYLNSSTGNLYGKRDAGNTTNWHQLTLGGVTFEPTGFPNRTASTITWNEGTRTLSIAPASGSYDFWVNGRKFTKSGTDSVVIPAASGEYAIYFDSSGTLQQMLFSNWDFQSGALVVGVYIRYASAAVQYSDVFEERHGIIMDNVTHSYLHRSLGAQWNSGGVASGFTLNTDTDAACQVALSALTFSDEDIPNALGQKLVGDSFFFLEAQNDGHWDDYTAPAATVPVFATAGVPFVSIGGTRTPVTNNNFFNTWVFASNTTTSSKRFTVLPGVAQFTTQAAAEAESITTLALQNLPTPEWLPLYQLSWEYKSSYGGTNKVRLRAVKDLRTSRSPAAAAGSAAYILAAGGSGTGNTFNTPTLTTATLSGATTALSATTTTVSGSLVLSALGANGVLVLSGTTVASQASTGSGNIVRATSPSLTTPTLGVAVATSLNINGGTAGDSTLYFKSLVGPVLCGGSGVGGALGKADGTEILQWTENEVLSSKPLVVKGKSNTEWALPAGSSVAGDTEYLNFFYFANYPTSTASARLAYAMNTAGSQIIGIGLDPSSNFVIGKSTANFGKGIIASSNVYASWDTNGAVVLGPTESLQTVVTTTGDTTAGCNHLRMGSSGYAKTLISQRGNASLIIGSNLLSISTSSDQYYAASRGTNSFSTALVMGCFGASTLAYDFRCTEGDASTTPNTLANYTRSLLSISRAGAITADSSTNSAVFASPSQTVAAAAGSTKDFDSYINASVGIVIMAINSNAVVFTKSGATITAVSGSVPANITVTVVNGVATNSAVRVTNNTGSTAGVTCMFLGVR